MQATDAFRVRGDLAVIVRRVSDRKVIERQFIRNTITFNGLYGLLRLWKQDDNVAADYQIASIRVGSGNTPPTRDDPSLFTPVATLALTAPSRQLSLPTSELVLTATVGTSVAVGSTICEAGWFYANGQMGGRQVHVPINLSGLITVSYQWRLAVTT